MRVRAADNQLWWVGRRWLPWRPRRTKKSDTDWGDGVTVLDLTPDEPIGCAIAVVLGAVLVAFPLLLVGVIFVAEWLIVLLILPVMTLIRVAWGMPWIVVARRWDGKRLRTLYSGQVKGWRASRELIEQVETEIRTMGAPHSLAPRG